jgi:hypothetical protein
LRNETGSFSSNGSERAAPNTGNNQESSHSEGKNPETKSSRGAWRISAQSSEQDEIVPVTATASSTAPPIPLFSKPQAVSSSRQVATQSTALPPRSPPRRSSSRLNPQPSPRTPSRPTNITTPPATSAYTTPHRATAAANGDDGNVYGSWDEQLGVLDRLSKQLSITAAQLSEDSPEKQRAVAQQRARRSSAADWQKYQDLAAQLESARSQLENLDSSDVEVSFAALMEDN